MYPHARSLARPLGLLLAAASVASTPARAQLGKGVEIPATPFAKPTGPYGVGTREYLWIDQSRGELHTRDPADKRHLMVQVWYPADVAPDAPRARYVLHQDEFANPAEYAPVLHVTTNAVTGAPVARGEKKYPVLLYNHGGGNSRFSGTFTTEYLASHGYVVVSIEHPGFAKIGTFPDGYKFVADTLTIPKRTGDFKNDVQGSLSWLGDVVFDAWMKDSEFALDQIEALDKADSLFKGRLDLGRIGALGWSFGGATAIDLSRADKRVKAAVDQDGQLFGGVREKGTSRPFMLFHNTSDPSVGQKPENQAILKETMDQVKSLDRHVKETATGDWYDVEIAKSSHGNFSDLLFFLPSPPNSIDPRRAHEIINAYTLAFFDKYLRGKPSELLAAATSPYAEVAYTKRR